MATYTLPRPALEFGSDTRGFTDPLRYSSQRSVPPLAKWHERDDSAEEQAQTVGHELLPGVHQLLAPATHSSIPPTPLPARRRSPLDHFDSLEQHNHQGRTQAMLTKTFTSRRSSYEIPNLLQSPPRKKTGMQKMFHLHRWHHNPCRLTCLLQRLSRQHTQPILVRLIRVSFFLKTNLSQ